STRCSSPSHARRLVSPFYHPDPRTIDAEVLPTRGTTPFANLGGLTYRPSAGLSYQPLQGGSLCGLPTQRACLPPQEQPAQPPCSGARHWPPAPLARQLGTASALRIAANASGRPVVGLCTACCSSGLVTPSCADDGSD